MAGSWYFEQKGIWKKCEIQTEETSKLTNSNLIFSCLKILIFNTFDVSQSVLNMTNFCGKDGE